MEKKYIFLIIALSLSCCNSQAMFRTLALAKKLDKVLPKPNIKPINKQEINLIASRLASNNSNNFKLNGKNIGSESISNKLTNTGLSKAENQAKHDLNKNNGLSGAKGQVKNNFDQNNGLSGIKTRVKNNFDKIKFSKTERILDSSRAFENAINGLKDFDKTLELEKKSFGIVGIESNVGNKIDELDHAKNSTRTYLSNAIGSFEQQQLVHDFSDKEIDLAAFNKPNDDKCQIKNTDLDQAKKDSADYLELEEDSLNYSVGIIGVGHLGQALANGLIKSKKLMGNLSDPKLSLNLYDINPSYQQRLLDDKTLPDFSKSVTFADSVIDCVKNSKIIIIAVKPSVVKELLSNIRGYLEGKILISCVAAISTDDLRQMCNTFYCKQNKATQNKVTQELGQYRCPTIIRAMPNLPVSEHAGVIGIFSNDKSFVDILITKRLLKELGKVIEFKTDKQLNWLTAVSGCGPALVAYLIDSFSQRWSFGIPAEVAEKVVLNTFKGSTELLINSKLTPKELIDLTATKGGVTETIIKNFEYYGIKDNIRESLVYGLDKINDISTANKIDNNISDLIIPKEDLFQTSNHEANKSRSAMVRAIRNIALTYSCQEAEKAADDLNWLIICCDYGHDFASASGNTEFREYLLGAIEKTIKVIECMPEKTNNLEILKKVKDFVEHFES